MLLRKKRSKAKLLRLKYLHLPHNFGVLTKLIGEKNAKFLIDENDFSADNITVDDFLYELSELINTPIITKNPLKNHKNLYDWQLHYRFFDLMESNLSDYGFQVRKVTSEYDVYVIKPL